MSKRMGIIETISLMPIVFLSLFNDDIIPIRGGNGRRDHKSVEPKLYYTRQLSSRKSCNLHHCWEIEIFVFGINVVLFRKRLVPIN